MFWSAIASRLPYCPLVIFYTAYGALPFRASQAPGWVLDSSQRRSQHSQSAAHVAARRSCEGSPGQRECDRERTSVCATEMEGRRCRNLAHLTVLMPRSKLRRRAIRRRTNVRVP